MGRAQQMMMEHLAEQWGEAASQAADPAKFATSWPAMNWFADPAKIAKAQVDLWSEGLQIWQRALGGSSGGSALEAKADKDKRFAAKEWREHPVFDMIRQTYLLVSDRLLGSVDAIEGVDERTREKMRFMTRSFVDAMSPSNFALTNPQVLERAIETKGESLLKGLDHMLHDLGRGQLSHTDPEAFEVGRNIATTPGKVVKQTPLYQLIQYSPATDQVLATPLIVFPPWINRFYILDLNPKKSFIKWAVDQGLTVFVVSWKSADESLADVKLGDYAKAQVEAIDAVRETLGVEAVHAIGYCVAGTALAATLALLAARGEQDKVASATFFTAQVDFSEAGDLMFFLGDEQMELIRQLSADKGYLDGRYMAATFNLLRGRDLIWNYVTSNYLLGEDYPQFDLLYWNSDTTNLPAGWHQSYLQQLYRENKLVQPGGDRHRRHADRPQEGRRRRPTSRPGARTISRRRRASGRSPTISRGRCASCSPARAISPAWSIRPRPEIPILDQRQAKVDTLDQFLAGATETRAAGGPTGSSGSRASRPKGARQGRACPARASSRLRSRMRPAAYVKAR